MKENKSFIQAIKVASQAGNVKNTLPILDCFLVDGNTITVSNLEVTITAPFEGDPFTACLPTALVLKGLKHINGEFDIEISNNIARFKSGEFEFEVPTSNPEDFPRTGEANGGNTVKVFNHNIAEAIKFVNNDDFKPILNGVALYSRDGKLAVVGTNGYHLYEHRTDIDFPTTLVIPTKAANILKDVPEFELSYSTNMLYASYNGVSLAAKTPEGTFPNYVGVIPKNDSILEVGYQELLSCVERVGEFSNEAKLLKLSVKQNSIDVISENIDFSYSAKETLKLSKPTTPIEIGLNYAMLAEILRIGKSYVKYSEPNRAVTVETDTKTILLMPMQISNG